MEKYNLKQGELNHHKSREDAIYEILQVKAKDDVKRASSGQLASIDHGGSYSQESADISDQNLQDNQQAIEAYDNGIGSAEQMQIALADLADTLAK